MKKKFCWFREGALLDDNKEYDDFVGEVDGKDAPELGELDDELLVDELLDGVDGVREGFDGSAFAEEDKLCDVEEVRCDGV